MVTVPLALALALDNSNLAGEEGRRRFVFHAGEYVFVATVATYAVSPLLFQPREWPIKALVQVIGVVVTRGTLRACGGKSGKGGVEPVVILGRLQWAYLALGLPALEWYATWGHKRVFGAGQYEFLPLMLTSTYCAAGVSFAYFVQAAGYLGADVSNAYVWSPRVTSTRRARR